MAEYIEREAFKAEIRRLSTHYLNEWDTLGVLAAADRIPAADVRPVVRGKWKKEFRANGWNEWYDCTCSRCGKLFQDFDPSNYCPNCGADMREES